MARTLTVENKEGVTLAALAEFVRQAQDMDMPEETHLSGVVTITGKLKKVEARG